jgi:hypothetical protein
MFKFSSILIGFIYLFSWYSKMSGSGGYYKYRCKFWLTYNCPNWVWVNNALCAHCLVCLSSFSLRVTYLSRRTGGMQTMQIPWRGQIVGGAILAGWGWSGRLLVQGAGGAKSIGLELVGRDNSIIVPIYAYRDFCIPALHPRDFHSWFAVLIHVVSDQHGLIIRLV